MDPPFPRIVRAAVSAVVLPRSAGRIREVRVFPVVNPSDSARKMRKETALTSGWRGITSRQMRLTQKRTCRILGARSKEQLAIINHRHGYHLFRPLLNERMIC